MIGWTVQERLTVVSSKPSLAFGRAAGLKWVGSGPLLRTGFAVGPRFSTAPLPNQSTSPRTKTAVPTFESWLAGGVRRSTHSGDALLCPCPVFPYGRVPGGSTLHPETLLDVVLP